MHLPNILMGFDLYVGDRNFAGVCSKFKLPATKKLLEALRAGGVHRAIKIAVGYEDDWDIEFTNAGLSLELLNDEANCKIDGVHIMILGSVKIGDNCDEKELEIHCFGQISEIDTGDQELGKLNETSTTMACDRVQIILDGVTMLDDHNSGMKRIINGRDVLAKRRANMGRA